MEEDAEGGEEAEAREMREGIWDKFHKVGTTLHEFLLRGHVFMPVISDEHVLTGTEAVFSPSHSACR